MSSPPSRPTLEVSDVILDSMDRMYAQLLERLDGLTTSEYLWEPVAETWSVRAGEGAVPRVDGAGERDVDPPPVTTIAWRLWHIAIDCLDDYTRRFRGDTTDASARWTLDPDEAIEMLQEKWIAYRGVVVDRDWWEELGTTWESWSRHSTADMAMHASNELVHHAAEIALLRDLYRTSFSQVAL